MLPVSGAEQLNACEHKHRPVWLIDLIRDRRVFVLKICTASVDWEVYLHLYSVKYCTSTRSGAPQLRGRATHLLADERVLNGREALAAIGAARVDRARQEEVPEALRFRLGLYAHSTQTNSEKQ